MSDFSVAMQQREFAATGLLRVDRFGYSLLHHAAAHNASRTIDFMLWATASFNTQLTAAQLQTVVDVREPARGFTPLHFAAANRNYKAALALIEKGHATVNLQDFDQGHSPLHLAVAKGDVQMVQLLLDCGAPVNQEDVDGVTPLHLAAANGFTNVAALLLIKGASPFARDHEGEIPLFYAARECHSGVAQLLMRAGSDARTAVNDDGETPIDVALESGDRAMAQLLATGQLPSVMISGNPSGPAVGAASPPAGGASDDAMDVDT